MSKRVSGYSKTQTGLSRSWAAKVAGNETKERPAGGIGRTPKRAARKRERQNRKAGRR